MSHFFGMFVDCQYRDMPLQIVGMLFQGGPGNQAFELLLDQFMGSQEMIDEESDIGQERQGEYPTECGDRRALLKDNPDGKEDDMYHPCDTHQFQDCHSGFRDFQCPTEVKHGQSYRGCLAVGSIIH